MIWLSIAIVVALLITLVLPVLVGFWLNKSLNVAWRVILYGVLGYFIVQALIALLYNGLAALIQSGTLVLSDQELIIVQIAINVILMAILGVLIRWAGMKYLKEKLDNLESAYGIGVGYGGVESIMLIGLPLLTTFITMLSNINIDPLTTTLDPAFVAQLEELWQIPAYVPLVGSIERIAAFVMHLTVTILILQVFKQNSSTWLVAAIGLELLVNGLIVGLGQAGVMYGWVILVAVLLMVGNFYILFRLNAFDFDITKAKGMSESE